MTTEALITVVKGSAHVLSLYAANSGYPGGVGRSVKACLEKCMYGHDSMFNDITYREYLEDIGWENRPKSSEEFLALKIPEKDIVFYDGHVVNKCARDEYSLAVRLCAGLFKDANEDSCPNSVQIYHGDCPEDIPYHYTISFRDYGKPKNRSADKRPHIIVTEGYEGKAIYIGWIDYWDVSNANAEYEE